MTLDGLLAEFRSSGEKFSKGRSSAYRGVSWNKNGQKWRMQISNLSNGKREQTFHDTEEGAARAYDARARAIHGR